MFVAKTVGNLMEIIQIYPGIQKETKNVMCLLSILHRVSVHVHICVLSSLHFGLVLLSTIERTENNYIQLTYSTVSIVIGVTNKYLMRLC